MIKIVCVVLLLLTAVGCATHQGSHNTVVRSSIPELSTEELAKIHDIPFPSQVKPMRLLLSDTQLVLTYVSSLSISEVLDFFTSGMEYWGWETLGSVTALESCLIFSKPTKICAITLRKEEQMTRVTLFTSVKKAY